MSQDKIWLDVTLDQSCRNTASHDTGTTTSNFMKKLHYLTSSWSCVPLWQQVQLYELTGQAWLTVNSS